MACICQLLQFVKHGTTRAMRKKSCADSGTQGMAVILAKSPGERASVNYLVNRGEPGCGFTGIAHDSLQRKVRAVSI